jgi:hypothetical protein
MRPLGESSQVDQCFSFKEVAEASEVASQKNTAKAKFKSLSFEE